MSSKQWKRKESDSGAFFDVEREPGSGSFGHARESLTCSDTNHPSLFIECKYRQKHAVWTLWRRTDKLATNEDKTPVLTLAEHGQQGQLLVIHSRDFPEVVAQWLARKHPRVAEAIMCRVKQVRGEE